MLELLMQELSVKLTKLGRQLQANQASLQEIKAALQEHGIMKQAAL